MMKDDFDVLVVGSGATGSWAAKALTEGGLEVGLVEAGASVTVERDFVSETIAADTIKGRTIQSRCGACRGFARRFFVNDEENPYSTPPNAPFNWFRGRQVGGRLHTWARHAPRISNQQFMPNATDDDRSWPLSQELLAPHYARVERRLGIFGRADGIESIPDGFFLPPSPLSPLAIEVCERVHAENPRTAITPARNVRKNEERIPLALADAQRTGRLTLMPDTIVSSIVVDDRVGRATGVRVVDRATKVHRELRGKNVVLGASAFESVRILLNTRSARYPHGLGAAGGRGVLGHYVCDHVFCVATGSLSADQGRRAAQSPRIPADKWDFAGTTLYLPGQQSETDEFIGKYGIQLCLSPQGWRFWIALAFGEMLPRFECAVRLAPDLRDAWGIPALHIDCTHSDNEVKMAAHMTKRLSELATIAGLKESPPGPVQADVNTAYGAFLPGGAVHEVGGARMGRSPSSSVVNSVCQCWECENVFVVDGSCFPYLPFQNPALTMMAIADRACDFIMGRNPARTE